jgi:hypothetical protein
MLSAPWVAFAPPSAVDSPAGSVTPEGGTGVVPAAGGFTTLSATAVAVAVAYAVAVKASPVPTLVAYA